jgi:formylmethanofuran dehydrogenase subunit E
MGNSLFLPGRGRVMIDKDVQQISRRSLETISRMHDVNAEVEGIEVRCMKCGESFMGMNNDNPNQQTLSLACKCRELRYIRGSERG